MLQTATRPRPVAYRAAVLAGAALLAGALASCSSTKPTRNASGQRSSGSSCSVSGKHVAVIGPLRGNPTLQLMAQGFKDQAAKDGFSPSVLLSEDANSQSVVTLGQQAIAQGTAGIDLIAFDPATYPLVAQAHAKGIPVVITHFAVTARQVPALTQDIVTDVAAYGKKAADALGKKLGGKGTVAITEGSFNVTENLAASSFRSEMKSKYAQVSVLAPQIEGFDPPAAISKLAAILQAHPDVTGAFSTTGGGPTDWSGAAAQANKQVAIISMDYTRSNLDLVKSGKVYALVGQPIYEENAMAADTLRDVLCRKPVPAVINPPSPLILRADLQHYYDLNARVGK